MDKLRFRHKRLRISFYLRLKTYNNTVSHYTFNMLASQYGERGSCCVSPTDSPTDSIRKVMCAFRLFYGFRDQGLRDHFLLFCLVTVASPATMASWVSGSIRSGRSNSSVEAPSKFSSS